MCGGWISRYLLHYNNPVKATDLSTLTASTPDQVAAWRWFAQYTGVHEEDKFSDDAVVVGVDGAASSASRTFRMSSFSPPHTHFLCRCCFLAPAPLPSHFFHHRYPES